MGDSIAERMDAGWQAARHWETECEAARNQLASVTAERDSWRQVHQTALDHAEEREKHHAETVARLTAERDALAAQLAALKKRVTDAPRKMLYPRDEGEKTGWVAMITLEDGE